MIQYKKIKNTILYSIFFTSMSFNVFAIDYSVTNNKKYIYEKQEVTIDESIQNPLQIKKENNLTCWDKAGIIYNIDPWLLVAVASVESSFNSNAVGKNIKNGKVVSYDLGLMQINTFWLPTLKKYNITMKNLFEPCVSIFVGAWIMAQNIKKYGYNIDGIGAYNSPFNVEKRRKYGMMVINKYKKITSHYKK